MARAVVRVRVYGKVQGVFFRASMKELADEVGVDGWVRNMDDGSVEAVIAGDEVNVKRVVEWCRRGPPNARVERLVVEEAEEPNVQGFRIRY
ncbi:MAG: acylphosphatase [Candidatus Caldarchaeum sp.]|nr:acylphosphatase [Candidatus Caldarchaeum sp.]MDW7978098.1 acylphosphatase [Candidatus Caldarchaeum sp.]MDW8360194.1 acylphosphatase [Candidatus Caldarchaeum sp.]